MSKRTTQNTASPRSAPLCGSSIEHDRRFIIKYMPQLDEYLHFRHINVSTIKELVLRWYPEAPEREFKKEKPHKALADILESIEELRHYRKYFFKPADIRKA